MLKALIDVHAGRVIGLGLFLFGILSYRSQNRDVFGWWSWPYLAVVVIAGILFLMAVAHSWAYNRHLHLNGHKPSLRSACSNAAFLMWGAGYFLNGLDRSENWGQIADLNAFGSAYPLATLLLWGALFTAILGLAETVVPRGRTSRWGATLLAIWITGVLLILIEGGIRIWAIVTPESQGYPTYTTALWSRKFVSVNHEGFRDTEHFAFASRESRRLLVVGDSLAFGWGLPRTEDRFGERLVTQLNQRTGTEWISLNASRGDTHTLSHIEFLKAMQGQRPDVTLLLYAFNDIDYLAQVTPRDGQSEHTRSILARISPVRVLFKNSFLFQGIYVRLRLITYRPLAEDLDPYEDDALLKVHFRDLDRFVSLAFTTSAVVAIIPFDIGVVGSKEASRHYNHFVQAAMAHGLPIWPVGPEGFSGHAYADLIVSKLDSHPNELAHQLLANSIADQVPIALGKQVAVELAAKQ